MAKTSKEPGKLAQWFSRLLSQSGDVNKLTSQPSQRTLTEEDYHAVGVFYYESNIRKLACANPEWKKKAAETIKEGKAGKRIFKNNYVNKPVKLVEEAKNPHDPNAVAVIIAGELVGYISREENIKVKDILKNRVYLNILGFDRTDVIKLSKIN